MKLLRCALIFRRHSDECRMGVPHKQYSIAMVVTRAPERYDLSQPLSHEGSHPNLDASRPMGVNLVRNASSKYPAISVIGSEDAGGMFVTWTNLHFFP